MSASIGRREFIALAGGMAALWPLAAKGQQLMPVIGWLSAGSPESDAFRETAFRQGLMEAGYTESQKVDIEYRWARGQNDRLPALAADLAAQQVTLILAVATLAALAAKAATPTIPIVFNVGDPVEAGLVASLNQPGANLTGVANMTAELMPKRLELLHELVPNATVVAVLVNPTNPVGTETETRNLRDAARLLGVHLHVLSASRASEIDAAFETLAELRARALFVSGDPFFTNRRDQVVALAARHAVPAIYVWREFVTVGGLMSYGNDLADGYRLAGILASKILRGARPADLPVQQAVKLNLVINLKTAKALGLTVPQLIFARADEVIE